LAPPNSRPRSSPCFGVAFYAPWAMEREFPILEYDPSPRAIIEPAEIIDRIDAPEACVLCFFLEVIEKVARERDAKVIMKRPWEDGDHLVYEIEHQGKRLAFAQPGVGAPPAAATLEELHAAGCQRFIACGGAGVLDKADKVGKLFVPNEAIRDEGTSYHYLQPSRTVEADPVVIEAIVDGLKRKGLAHEVCRTWTIDSPFRETIAKAAMRKAEGCKTVEMETAAFLAVARFRGIPFGQILYGGDAVVAEGWDKRAWQDRKEIRERLFWLAADIAVDLPDTGGIEE